MNTPTWSAPSAGHTAAEALGRQPSGREPGLAASSLQMHGEAARHQARLVECAGIQGGAKAFWSAIDAIFAQSAGNGAGCLAAHCTFLNWTRLDWKNVRKTWTWWTG